MRHTGAMVLAMALVMGMGLTAQGVPMILLNAEGDSGTTATDKLTADGQQDGTWTTPVRNATNTGNQEAVTVMNSGAAFGSSCFNFPTRSYYATPNRITLTGVNFLGSEFTLSMMAKFDGTSGPYQESDTLFSSYSNGALDHSFRFKRFGFGSGEWTPYFQFGTSATTERAISGTSCAAINGDGTWHQLALTYNNGVVDIYYDGVRNTGGTLTTAERTYFETTMARDLQVGSDRYDSWMLWGQADDVLVYNQALPAGDITTLYQQGAGFLVPEPISLTLLGLGGMSLIRRKR